MNCNCNNCQNGASGNEPFLCHPQGNLISITLPMSSVYTSVINGSKESTDRNFPIYDVVVTLKRGKHEYEFKPTISTNNITFFDRGTLPLGTYDLIIKYRGTDSMPYKYVQDNFLQIVAAVDSDAGYDNDKCDVIAYYPKVKGQISAIEVTDTEVSIHEGRGFEGDNTPLDNYADMGANYGSANVEINDNEIILNI